MLTDVLARKYDLWVKGQCQIYLKPGCMYYNAQSIYILKWGIHNESMFARSV